MRWYDILKPLENTYALRSPETLHQLFLLLGSNEGDRLAWLSFARQQVIARIGLIAGASQLYMTAPWGKTDQPEFINQALLVHTPLTIHDIHRETRMIERVAGRQHVERWGPRTLDIDILFYDDDIVSTEHLTVPHPRIQERRFALVPMAEIAPEYHHPVLGLTIRALLTMTPDHSEVSILPPQ